MTIILQLVQWSTSAPFQEVQIDLSTDGLYVTIGHPPPGASRTAGQCWLSFEVVEFDHARVWRKGRKVCPFCPDTPLLSYYIRLTLVILPNHLDLHPEW
jgi:hypothetical protein